MDVLEKAVASDIRLALASSSTRKMLEKGLSVKGLEDYFASIVAGDDVVRHKPHPEAFMQTTEKLGILPEETMIVGDSKVDIEVGKAMGMHTCLFTPKENELFYDFEDLRRSGPDLCITKQEQLVEILVS